MNRRPQRWVKLLKILALLGAIATFIAVVLAIPPISPIFWSGGGVPGYWSSLWRLAIYASIISSSVEVLLIGWLGYLREIPCGWAFIGVSLFGTIALIATISLREASQVVW